MRMSRRMKIELALAILMAMALSISAAYVSTPKSAGTSVETMSQGGALRSLGGLSKQQVINEDIQGELKKGAFETVVEDLRRLTFQYGGSVSFLTMAYENGLWNGKLACDVPTSNVTVFTFGVRQLIGEHGKVTRIAISITEIKINRTEHPEEPVSDVSINLKESIGGESSILSQVGAAIPYLTIGLVWVAQGLMVGVPLSFVSLGVIIIIDRGIVPAWKRQFRGKGLNKSVH